MMHCVGSTFFGDVSIANLCTEGKTGGFFRELCVTSVNCTCDQGDFHSCHQFVFWNVIATLIGTIHSHRIHVWIIYLH